MRMLIFIILVLSCFGCSERVKAPDTSEFVKELSYNKEMRKCQIGIEEAEGKLTDNTAELTKLKYEGLHETYLICLMAINDMNRIIESRGLKVTEVDTLFTRNKIPLFTFRGENGKTSRLIIKEIDRVLMSLDSIDTQIGYNSLGTPQSTIR